MKTTVKYFKNYYEYFLSHLYLAKKIKQAKLHPITTNLCYYPEIFVVLVN